MQWSPPPPPSVIVRANNSSPHVHVQQASLLDQIDGVFCTSITQTSVMTLIQSNLFTKSLDTISLSLITHMLGTVSPVSMQNVLVTTPCNLVMYVYIIAGCSGADGIALKRLECIKVLYSNCSDHVQSSLCVVLISIFCSLSRLAPEHVSSHNNLGTMLGLEEAEYHLREAVKHNPQHSRAHYNLGNLLRLGVHVQHTNMHTDVP